MSFCILRSRGSDFFLASQLHLHYLHPGLGLFFNSRIDDGFLNISLSHDRFDAYPDPARRASATRLSEHCHSGPTHSFPSI